jgi:hypothetical protein
MIGRIFRLPLVTLALLLANLLLPQPGQAAADAVVTLVAQPPQVAAGEALTLSVDIAGIQSLYGIELRLQFDAERLQALPNLDGKAATAGDLMGHDFVAVNAFDNATGTIDYAAVQMNPRAPASGDGNLITIRFKALAAGNATINFTSLILSDINGIPLAATTANSVVAVAGPGATPEPATPAPGITALAPPAKIRAPEAATTTPPSATPAQPTITPTAESVTATPAPGAGAGRASPVATATRDAIAASQPAVGPTSFATTHQEPASSAAQPSPTESPTPARVTRAAQVATAQPPALPAAPTSLAAASPDGVIGRRAALLAGAAAGLLAVVVVILSWRRGSGPS